MPARNSLKIYSPASFYHIYNRGVARNDIFLEEADFAVFLSYLKVYLSPKKTSELTAVINSNTAGYKEKYEASKLLSLKNFWGKVKLIAYSLLPNHFHLLIKQTDNSDIDSFMSSLETRYSGFFNRKYRRVGPVCQGVYKAVLVTTDEQLLYVSKYIHLNPLTKLHLPVKAWAKCPWPYSLPEYLGARKTSWLNPQPILEYFNQESKNNSYLSFMSQNLDLKLIAPLAIDFEDEA